jgi:hypothetical protein
MTSDQSGLTRAQLRTPRAAAIAGVLFSVLLLAVFWLIRLSIPADPHEPGAWLKGGVGYVAVALNLVPFAGIAFLWFVGALRDRLGAREDRFFATVFLGSGLLVLAMLFAAAAVVGAIIIAFHSAPEVLIGSATFHFGRGAGLRDDQHLRRQDGVGLHDHHVDHRPLHAPHAALARNRRIRGRGGASDRKLLFRLEPSDIPAVGPSGQRLHSCRRASRASGIRRSFARVIMPVTTAAAGRAATGIRPKARCL